VQQSPSKQEEIKEMQLLLKPFLEKLLDNIVSQIKINVDKSGANKCALDAINDNYPEDQKIEIRQNKYLNNMIERGS
jgi:putative transposase